MKITYEGWDPVDRQPVRGTVQGLDRAQTQAADQVTVHLAHSPQQGVTIKQNPTQLKGARVRVGAAVWDGAYVLAAYLDAQPAGSFQGQRCVELGCGCGLLGLVLARLGAAAVYLTDKPQLLVGPRVNAAKNKLLAAPTAAGGGGCRSAPNGQVQQPPQHPLQPANQQQPQQQPPQQPVSQQQQPQPVNHQQPPPPAQQVVQVVGLDWEDAASLQQAAAAITAQAPVDLIVASDCIYPDPDGSCPSSTGFMAAVTALATPGHTRVLTTFETRSDELRQALMAAAAAAAVPDGGRVDVVRLGPEQLPEGYQAEHVEVYELRLLPGAASGSSC